MTKVRVLYYSPSVNRFADEDWCIIHDLHKLFGVWQLDIWKKKKDHGVMTARNGQIWKLYYLSSDEDDDVYDCIKRNRLLGVQMDRVYY